MVSSPFCSCHAYHALLTWGPRELSSTPADILPMWRRVPSIWYGGIPGSAAVCLRGGSQATVTEGQEPQPVCCAGRRYSARQHQWIPPVSPGDRVPGRDLRLVPHIRDAVLRDLLQRSAGLHNEVLVTHPSTCRLRPVLRSHFSSHAEPPSASAAPAPRVLVSSNSKRC